MPTPPSPRRNDIVIAAALTLVCALAVAPLLHTGWVPSDEGTLAQSALRTLNGQLPQRDFAEIYTGGLSLWHALAFRVFGINLFSLRLAVFLVFLAWVPVVYGIVRRFLSPLWGAVATLTAVSWSYPNYVAAMPSWYNLFLATFGTAAALRFLETRFRRWLLLAGLCTAASVLVKITGLYFVAALLLFLLLDEQHLHSNPSSPPTTSRSMAFRLFVAAGLLSFLAVLLRLLAAERTAGSALHFFLPSATLVALYCYRERHVSSDSSHRWRALLRTTLPFLLGLTLPIAAFLIPYVRSGSTRIFLHGVAGSGLARLSQLGGRQQIPGLPFALYGLVTITLIAFGLFHRQAAHRKVVAPILAALTIVLTISAFAAGLQDTWLMAGTLTPFVILLGAAILASRSTSTSPATPSSPADDLAAQRLALLLCVAAVCSLIQFPVSYVTYFCYAAPLTLLAVLALAAVRRPPLHPSQPRPLLAALLLFFLIFGCCALVRKHIYNPALDTRGLHPLTLPRAGRIRVDATTPGYEELIPFLAAHSPNGLMIAGNDCPELYFLTGLHNPTRDDTGAPVDEVLDAIRSPTLHLFVINEQTFFAAGIADPEVRAAAERGFPHAQRIGHFEIYWR